MRRVAVALLSVSLLSLPLYAEEEQSLGTRFAVAIEDHDLDAVKALIEEEHAAVDTPIDYGSSSITPLIKASWDGDLPIVQYLLSKGADVNARDTESKQTALLNAVSNGHVEIVRALIAAKANVSLRNTFDFNPFTTAVAAGNEELSLILLEAGAKPDDGTSGLTPLMFAASSGNTSMMHFLVKHGADVNFGAKTGGQTALISAILGAQMESVKTLIELKANVNAAMKDGTTPLKLARKGDQNEMAALLVAAGAKK
jgi:ankyrin repeat protein